MTSRLRRATRRLIHDDQEEDDNDTHVMDEQEQQDLITMLQQQANSQETLFITAFLALMLFPTPLYISLPYCRHNASLSLLSLISIALSAYSLHFGHRTHGLLSAALALIIAVAGYVQHAPWRRFDYLWILPLVSALSGVMIRRWTDQTRTDLADLAGRRYKLKGA